MATIKDKAQTYKPVETKNVADLEVVAIDLEIEEKTFNAGEDNEFSINVINVKGEDYRVPNSVIKQLNILLDDKPNMKGFKVKKTGTGLNTQYTVIPV